MDPVFLSIGPLELRWYGVLIAAGIVLGAVWAVRAARSRGLDPEWMLDTAPWAVVAGVVGARLVYVLTSPAAYFGPGGSPLSAFAVWEGGLSIHGAVGAVIAVFVWRARAQGRNVWRYLDVMMPVMALSIIGGRLGNFMNGTDSGGRLTELGIGFTWPEPGTPTLGAFGRLVFGEPLWMHAPPACRAPFAAGEACVIHLTPIYGALIGVALLGVIVWVQARSRKHGAVLLHSLIWYSVLRSVFEEPFRDNPLVWNAYLNESAGIGLFTATQLASVVVIGVAWWLLWRRPLKSEEPDEEPAPEAARSDRQARSGRPKGGVRAAARREAERKGAKRAGRQRSRP